MSDLLSSLNDQQRQAATHIDTHSLIIAGAGSGKTRTLTCKIAHLILDHGCSPQQILAVTFTNKAANEMKERVQELMRADHTPEDRSAAPSASTQLDFDALVAQPGQQVSSTPSYHRYDYQRIGTFHSIFLKILKQDIKQLGKNYTSSFTIYDASHDAKQLIRSVLKQLNLQDRLELREVMRKISTRKNAGRLPEQAGYKCETQRDERALTVYQRYQHELEQANALDFDDLLLLTKELFTAQPDVLTKWQEKFRYILVDEAQDTNAIQFELIRLLAGGDGVLTLIGDDYQSIYKRRGAQMDNFLNVKQRRPEIELFKLETNYRSRSHIVQAGNALIEHNTKQYDKEVAAHRQGSDLIRLFEFADEVDEATQIIELITKIKEEQELTRNDFTILYRTNAQSHPFEQVLLTEGIPYQVVGAFKFFERKEIKDILAYIKFLLNPHDTVSLKRIINTPHRKIGATTLGKLDQLAATFDRPFNEVFLEIETYDHGLSPAVLKRLTGFRQIVRALQQSVEQLPPADLLDFLVKNIRYKDFLIKQEGEEKALERMENIWQLLNMASKYDQPGLDTLTEMMEEISLLTSIEEVSEEQSDAIKLMTVHASKWLEFPYVFVVGLEENIFPLPKAKFDDDELEEERRAMYVAITRAEDHLFLSYAQSRHQRGQLKYNPPSRFIEELPPQLLKSYTLAQASRGPSWPDFDEGDQIRHKLFGPGVILELRQNVAIVKFDNPKFHIRKLETRFLSRDG